MMLDGLFPQTIIWLLHWRRLLVIAVIALVVASAVAVVLASHKTRRQYTVLQEIRLESDRLDSEYEKLLLEQSAWAGFTRVDQVSRNELGMQAPSAENLIIVKR